jgi:hypothetical protein
MNSNASTDTSSSSSTAVSAEAISRRAYELWEQDGRPDGNDLRHWLQAEKELTAGGTNGDTTRYTDQPQARPTANDARPLQGQAGRPASTSNRDGKRTSPASQNPFTEKNGGNTAVATKRR